MTAHAPETVTARPMARENDFPLPQEIDASCRTPVIFMLVLSALWLVISLLFGILATIKMHAPGMLAHSAALTYGRVAAVASSVFLYGFASQAGIAIALWLFARLGRTFLILPRAGIVAALVWNLAVLLGAGGILAGEMTHFPTYEMPPWTSWLFLISFVILGLSAVLTFVARNERDLYPTNWFLFAAMFVFPWILSVAYLLLGRYSIRPVLEPVIATWFANNFVMLWLSPIALGILFYFISKLSHQPLLNYASAAFGFWFYVLFATGSGFQNTPGVPNWLPNLSVVVNTLLLLPAGVIGLTWYQTWVGHRKAQKAKDRTSSYVTFSAIAFLVMILINLLLSCPKVDQVVGLTIFKNGASTWALYGFIGMALFAAIHHILPRLTEVEWPSSGLSAAHYGLTVAGILVTVAAFVLGGYVQGNAINDPSIPFSGPAGVVRKVVPYVGISTIGLIFLLIAQLALVGNMFRMLGSCLANCCGICAGKEVVR